MTACVLKLWINIYICFLLKLTGREENLIISNLVTSIELSYYFMDIRDTLKLIEIFEHVNQRLVFICVLIKYLLIYNSLSLNLIFCYYILYLFILLKNKFRNLHLTNVVSCESNVKNFLPAQ